MNCYVNKIIIKLPLETYSTIINNVKSSYQSKEDADIFTSYYNFIYDIDNHSAYITYGEQTIHITGTEEIRGYLYTTR